MGKFANSRLIGVILVSLGIAPAAPQCSECNNSLKINLNLNELIPIRYWCGKFSKRYEARRFSAFTFTRTSAINILQIMSLFVDGHGTTEIVAK